MIALGTINDVGLYRSLIGHGVHDYLVKPVEAAALSSALLRAAGGPQGDAAGAKPGRLIAVVGARGGVGATSVAVNLAWTIAHEQNRRVALVDLDLFFGTCALALDLEMGHGFREAMENPARMDSLFIERSMVRESENLFVLSAEEALDAAFNFDAQAIELLLEHLRRDFQYVDFPRYGVRRQARVLTPPAAVVVVSDASLAGMRDTMRLTKLLKAAVPNAEVTICMNRIGAEKSGELGRTEFEKGAETKVDLLIPFEAKGFAASAAAGKPVVKVAGRTKAAAAIRALARRLATTSADKAKGRCGSGSSREAANVFGSRQEVPVTSPTPQRRPPSSGLPATQEPLAVTSLAASAAIPAASAAAAAPAAPALEQETSIEDVTAKLAVLLRRSMEAGEVVRLSRANLAMRIADMVDEVCQRDQIALLEGDRRNLVTVLINQALSEAQSKRRGGTTAGTGCFDRSVIETTKQRIQPILLERIDVSRAITLPPEGLSRQISDVVGEILGDEKLQLNSAEQRDLVTALLNDLLGLGPLEVLLADDTVTDIMVNGPKQVYVERKGKLQLTDVTFRDNAHVMSICTRIVTRIGRRVDETTPLCDARLSDGSRVNIIIPPLALDGPSISIRKFARHQITLDVMERQRNLSPEMATVLKIAGRCRLNILISGGTGSGKTTLLNALSRMIDHGERIVTIEDAAELQLQQPHVVRLETRPPNLEGQGEVTQRDLVKNALRMRPDRIILGEIRSGEALDMLQAMNTGHDGSLGTIHANRPREALTRLENMVAMTGIKLPHEAVRAQIAGALNMIVQVSRMRDGVRRITHISEVVGMEGEIITMQDLFTFEYKGEDAKGRLIGSFRCSGLRPHFTAQAEYFGLNRTLLDTIGRASEVEP